EHQEIEVSEVEHLRLDELEMRQRGALAVLGRAGELLASSLGEIRAGVEEVEPARACVAAELVVSSGEDPGRRGQQVAGRLEEVQPPGFPAVGVRIAGAVLAEVGTWKSALLRGRRAVSGVVVPALDLLAVDRGLEAARRAAVVVVADVEDEIRMIGGGGLREGGERPLGIVQSATGLILRLAARIAEDRDAGWRFDDRRELRTAVDGQRAPGGVAGFADLDGEALRIAA